MLSILFYLRWLKVKESGGKKSGSYALTLLFAALAMMCKSSTVVLPVVLCLCAWWMEGRWQWRNVARTAPIFLMAVADSLLSMWTQKHEVASLGDLQWMQKLARSVW